MIDLDSRPGVLIESNNSFMSIAGTKFYFDYDEKFFVGMKIINKDGIEIQINRPDTYSLFNDLETLFDRLNGSWAKRIPDEKDWDLVKELES